MLDALINSIAGWAILPFLDDYDRARLRNTSADLADRDEAKRVRMDYHSFQSYWLERDIDLFDEFFNSQDWTDLEVFHTDSD